MRLIPFSVGSIACSDEQKDQHKSNLIVAFNDCEFVYNHTGECTFPTEVRLSGHADTLLCKKSGVAISDSGILDRSGKWFNLAQPILRNICRNSAD
ncbi:DUF5616 domain-containing protein [Sporolactobacillus pectinivorans]|uniref:DUF5616 domain-containing protein n=1 Tax=Sporolactobacillus pectinivorans TaxID=1591408 RepID=UPI000C25B8BE